MYCIECGAIIPENSKFCPHCGVKQTLGDLSINQQVAEKIIENEIVKQIVEQEKQTINYHFIKKAIGWYLAWVVLNLCILLIFSENIFKGDYDSNKFYPFSEYSKIENYDIREFLVYTLVPLAFIIIRSLVSNSPKEKSEIEKDL